MNSNHFPEIETERLILRKLKESDWGNVSYLRSDAEVNKFVQRSSAESKEKAIAFIATTNQSIADDKLFYWAITEKDNNEMIGSICLWNFSENRKRAEAGYDLNPKFQKKGIMDEAMKSILKFGFDDLNLNMIDAYTQKQNENSRKLLVRNGFILNVNRKDEHNADNLIYEVKRKL